MIRRKQYLLLALLSCVIGFACFGQNSVNVNYGNWSFGVNLGGTYIDGDVKSKGGNGGGIFLGHTIYYKPYSIFRWDLQGRIMGSTTHGASQSLSSTASLNPALNGSYKPTLNYSGVDMYHNYRVKGTEHSLELVLSANRLRERTKIILQGFIGIGAYYYKVNIDQLDEFGNQYAYTSSSTRDYNYESHAYGSTAWKSYFVPTLGYGIGYQVWPATSVLFEHKMTFPFHSNLDGNPFETRTGFYPYDVQHFIGLGLRFNFGGGEKAETKPATESSSTPSGGIPTSPPKPDPIVPAQLPPKVTISNPPQGYMSTYNERYTIIAEVKRVDNSGGINYSVNGQPSTQFTYNANTDKFQSEITLRNGSNIISISGTNAAGSDTKTANIEKKHKNDIPTVKFTNPNSGNAQTDNDQYYFKASVTGIKTTSQVHVTFNGLATTSYNFDSQTGEITYSANLVDGDNKLYIVAENDAGKSNAEAIITYEKPQAILGKPPVVTAISPKGSPYLSKSCFEKVRVSVTGVTAKSQIKITAGRRVLDPAKWTFKNGIVEFTEEITSEVRYLIIATTDYGTGQDEVNIKCDKQLVICHNKPEGTGTETITIPANSWPLHQAHGDSKGTCAEPKPTLKLKKPTTPTYTSKSGTASVQIITTGIISKTQIKVTKNGSNFTKFTFASNKISWSETITSKATYNIIATNDGGSANQTVVITPEAKITICHHEGGKPKATMEIPISDWAKHQAHGDSKGKCLDKPIAKINSPKNGHQSTNSTIAIKGKVTGAKGKQQVKLLLNGVAQSFNYTDGSISANIVLKQGQNIVKLTATGADGKSTDTITITYKPTKQSTGVTPPAKGSSPPKKGKQ